jgi:hypothetical protein
MSVVVTFIATVIEIPSLIAFTLNLSGITSKVHHVGIFCDCRPKKLKVHNLQVHCTIILNVNLILPHINPNIAYMTACF